MFNGNQGNPFSATKEGGGRGDIVQGFIGTTCTSKNFDVEKNVI